MTSMFIAIPVLAIAGVLAGTVSAVVGNGTLIAFPAMLLCGFPNLMANMTTAIGLVPGSVSAAVAMHPELKKQGSRVLRLGIGAVIGASVGAVLLLRLPSQVFVAATPILIFVAVVLVAIQPWAKRRLQDREAERNRKGGTISYDREKGLGLLASVTGVGVYTGYFGGGAGLAFYSILAIMLPEPLKRSNAVKVVLVLLANLIAGTLFIVLDRGHISWRAVAILAVGSIVGGQIGAHIGRRFPDNVLRYIILTVGIVALIYSLVEIL